MNLYSLLSIPSESGNSLAMEEFIIHHLTTLGVSIGRDKAGNIYGTKGKAKTFPCFVAHLDTVHEIECEQITPIEIEGKITGFNADTMSQTGIGGDDKCGIYAAIKTLENLPSCKVAFFRDEEIGCKGSYKADVGFFKNCRFILQADRRGSSDFVTDIGGPLSSSHFQKTVAPILARHGYKKSHGMMSDVMALRDLGVNISLANVSAGYYNPHCSNEYIVKAELENVILMFTEIGKLEQSFQFTPPPKSIPFHYAPKYPSAPAYGAGTTPSYGNPPAYGFGGRYKPSRRQRRHSKMASVWQEWENEKAQTPEPEPENFTDPADQYLSWSWEKELAELESQRKPSF